MSDDQNGKSGGWFGNPLPILMVVLLAGGLLVQTEPLKSARPTDPERVKFAPTSLQDVEARLWQDPFAAVEKDMKSSEQAVTLPKNTLMMLFSPTGSNTSSASNRLDKLNYHIQELNKLDDVTVVAVSVFGGPYTEDAESRRRSRFAVVSALGFHDYQPASNDAIGYFQSNLSEPNGGKKPVPFEWFKKQKEGKTSHVLVLWLKDETLIPTPLTPTPLTTLRDLFNELTPSHPYNVNFKLIGPADSGTLKALVRESQDLTQQSPSLLNDIEVYSPSATISNCDLTQEGSQPKWDCFKNPPSLQEKTTLPIVRTIGSDDVLAAALRWELWQRGVNRNQAPAHQCEDGLVLIGERDTQYGRTLLRYIEDGFSDRCGSEKQVRTFSYLRGLDGVLPDIDKSANKAPPKDDSSKSKDLREQLEDAPPEHAEGRNQFDYLRRLADEIDRLDDNKSFAKNGVKAIGLVGSDLYDKLLILQALRSRFKDKIFFTTDLDARYLHADQNDWVRNLVVASNFGLSLNPALQGSTLPFRDSYQTATYLATLMALEKQSFDWTFGMENWLRPGLQQSTQPVLDSYLTATQLPPPAALKGPPINWTDKMEKWLSPQIFEIGRTEAVHLASPSIPRLKNWIEKYSEDSVSPETETPCDDGWEKCKNIEPTWPSRGLSLDHPWAISFMFCFGLLLFTLANYRVNETLRVAFSTSSPERSRARAMMGLVIAPVVVVSIILWVIHGYMHNSLEQGDGEPFLWLEGVSVWPSLVVRFVGLVTMLALVLASNFWIRQQAKQMSRDFCLGQPGILTDRIRRSWWSAVRIGPYLDVALFDERGYADRRGLLSGRADITTLWWNYLRATHWREMAGWIVVSVLIIAVLFFAAFFISGPSSFPHRGQLVLDLHHILGFLNALVLWPVIFWVGYETRACARFNENLSAVRSLWPEEAQRREQAATGLPGDYLNDYLDIQLIVRATQRIHWLIYLPFVSILFMVLPRSNFFDAMDFPLAQVFITGLALAYSLHSARLLQKSAEAVRTKALEYYEKLWLGPGLTPIMEKQIMQLMKRIDNNREGAFVSLTQQPALQALLIPFGGYGGVQIIEYLIKLFGAP